MAGLDNLGIKFDAGKNKSAVSRDRETDISADDSPVKVLVIPTDEEIVFIEDVIAVIEGRYTTHTHFKYSFEDPKYRKKG